MIIPKGINFVAFYVKNNANIKKNNKNEFGDYILKILIKNNFGDISFERDKKIGWTVYHNPFDYNFSKENVFLENNALFLFKIEDQTIQPGIINKVSYNVKHEYMAEHKLTELSDKDVAKCKEEVQKRIDIIKKFQKPPEYKLVVWNFNKKILIFLNSEVGMIYNFKKFFEKTFEDLKLSQFGPSETIIPEDFEWEETDFQIYKSDRERISKSIELNKGK